jgi:hypothetical protein
MNSTTQLNIVAGRPITIIGSTAIPSPIQLNVSDFYQGIFPGGTTRYSTGEPYEGMIVELRDLTVTALLNPARGTFTMQDAGGNEISTYDMSKFFTLGHGGTVIGPPDSVWAITYPLIGPGTKIRSIKGLINNGSGSEIARGYRIAPMYRGDVAFAPPVITSFSPLTGTVGSSVTIAGTDFEPTPANNTVYFGAVRATVTSASSTSLSVTVPSSATYAPITVTSTVTGLTAYSRAPFIVTFPSSQSIDTRAFAAKVDFAMDNNPFMLAVGDLDGDGRTDAVAASTDSSFFTLLRNTSAAGTIAFAPGIKLRAGEIPNNAFLGDIDGDGKLDLAHAAISANAVSIFRNTSTPGNLSFAAKLDSPVGANPRRIAIQDYDGDGKPDLAVTNLDNNAVSVLRNTSSVGNISFESKIDFATGNWPHFILAGDVDGDGKSDLIVMNYDGNSFSILLNTSTSGSLSFGAKVDFGTGARPYIAGLGDLDGDGRLDLAVPNMNGNSVSVHRNTSSVGSISFAPSVDLNVGNTPRRVAMGDIDGDGKPDLAVSIDGGNSVSIFKNVSTSGIVQFDARIDLPAGSNPLDVSISDIDGDTQPDLVVSNRTGSSVSTFRNVMTQQAVTFQVNMKVKMLESTFSPSSGDVVRVAGSFNGWNTSADTLRDADGDSIYTKTISNLQIGSITYKFWKTIRGGLEWEGDPSREYTVVAGSQTLPVVYFDRDSVVASNAGSAYLKNRSMVRVLDADPVRPDANPTAYQITGSAITLEAWIFPIGLPPFPGSDIIMSRPTPSNTPGGYDLAIRDTSQTGEPRLSFRVSLGDTHLVVRDVALAQVGVWQHVAGTYDGATAKLYVNGSLVASASLSRSIAAGQEGFFIGGRNNATAFHGLIDEVRLWNIARLQSDIQTYKDSTLIGNETGLAGYWPLDIATTVNGKYPIAVDKTTNHNDLWAIQDAEFVSQPTGSAVALPPELFLGVPEGTVGNTFSFTPSTGGWPIPVVSFVFGPIGMSFNPSTGYIIWVPISTQAGFNQMRLRATNSTGIAETTYTIWVNTLPTVWRTHNNNAVTLHVANSGVIGREDPTTGFNFNGLNGLWGATVIVGRASNQVSGTLYAREFAAQDTFSSIVSYLDGFDQAFETRFNDQRAANPIGVRITQRSHSKSTDPHRQTVILDYEILNTSGSEISGIYIGLAADFDVGDAPLNLPGYDVARGLVYTYQAVNMSNPFLYGMLPLTGTASGIGAWVGSPQLDQTDTAFYNCLTNFTTIPVSPPGDYREIVGTGAYNIPVGGSVRVMFALVAGTNLTELQATADAARSVLFRPQPTILSVRDVPNDQGGHVTLRWNASSLDDQIHNLPYYSIWRSLPDGALFATKQTRYVSTTSDTKPIEVADARIPTGDGIAVSPKYRFQMIDGVNYAWEWIADQPAHRFATYSYTAPTLYDSMSITNGRHYFLVSAQTNDPYVYYDSNIDSGYSVDNLSPSTPLHPGVIALDTVKVKLTWDRNLVDPDLSHYAVYRDTTSGFVCADSTEFCLTMDTTIIDSAVQRRLSYYYRVVAVDIHGNESPPTPELFNPSALTSRANIWVLLEGPYNPGTNSMNKTLNAGGYLAAHFGSIAIPAEAVDSISVELRNAASSPTTRKYLPAWLLTDGSIRDFSDTTKSYVEFDTLAGNYFLVIRHRNHLPVMTAMTQALNGATPPAYDFTSSQTKAYGSNAMKAVGTSPVRYAMVSGDASGNGQVAPSDINFVIRPALTQSGYRAGDINLNGQVQNTDMNIYTRPNLGKGTQVPSRPVEVEEKEVRQ